jgi:RHS repeat-associated protein
LVGLHEQMWRGPQGAVTELLAVTDNVDILARNAVYGVQPGGQRGTVIAHTDGDPDTAAYSHYFHDHLGTPQTMRDASKALTARQHTSPYGISMVSSGIPVDVGYTGHKWDDELDSFYAPYRYYNPWNARWSVRDPLGMVDGPNVYGYANMNSIRNTDPLGLIIQCVASLVPIIVTVGGTVTIIYVWQQICKENDGPFGPLVCEVQPTPPTSASCERE